MIVASPGNLSGQTLDFYAFDADGLVWDGAAYVAWSDADYADYRIAATETGTTGRYVADLPDDAASWELRYRGASLAASYAVDGGPVPGLTPDQAAQLASTYAKTLTLGSGTVTVASPVSSAGDVTIVRGDDYAAADGRALDFVNADGTWPDLTGATVVLTARRYRSTTNVLSASGSVVVASGAGQQVRIPLAAADTADVRPDIYPFDIQATLASGRVVTLATGTLTVTEDRTTA